MTNEAQYLLHLIQRFFQAYRRTNCELAKRSATTENLPSVRNTSMMNTMVLNTLILNGIHGFQYTPCQFCLFRDDALFSALCACRASHSCARPGSASLALAPSRAAAWAWGQTGSRFAETNPARLLVRVHPVVRTIASTSNPLVAKRISRFLRQVLQAEGRGREVNARRSSGVLMFMNAARSAKCACAWAC